METPSLKTIRIFRSKDSILDMLSEYKKSKLSIKAFCAANNIASATFHYWKNKYGNRIVKTAKPKGFATLQINTAPVIAEPLFAEVKSIKIYQWVTAAYLKELLA